MNDEYKPKLESFFASVKALKEAGWQPLVSDDGAIRLNPLGMKRLSMCPISAIMLSRYDVPIRDQDITEDHFKELDVPNPLGWMIIGAVDNSWCDDDTMQVRREFLSLLELEEIPV